ncbi:universal stress protein [Natronolimnohabitans innermongolicus]|uniref:UspA domain-containing protein n=1 Tax=Natronolimnohabitans innermongolicus JCM 12255 TaxID=1227499 RepID=L9WH76_9EURY|nr:universal stress protein [Natronolimnohabitans innermongolicus]ELY48586.1 UspA domain-containing protein [Natronolimnohabitans innermongolicus JCM 12255]
MYRDILLATDGTEGAKQATDHALELAEQLGATVHIVSVSEEGPHSSEKRDEMRSDLEEEAAQALEEAERTAADRGVETTTTIRQGVPQEEIVDAAETNAMDLIVMGTHGRSGLDHLVVGSVAEEVVRNAPVPVVTVRERDQS